MNRTDLMEKLKRISAEQAEKKATQQEAAKALMQKLRAAAKAHAERKNG